MPGYSRLTESKRYTIETLHRKRTPQIKIAEILDVHPSTISRELRRLGGPVVHTLIAKPNATIGSSRSAIRLLILSFFP